ncbi:hypothetical protein ACFL46_02075 [Candidatus Neomarinimicrobiota bacterium]
MRWHLKQVFRLNRGVLERADFVAKTVVFGTLKSARLFWETFLRKNPYN